MGREYKSDYYDSVYSTGGWNNTYFKSYKDIEYFYAWLKAIYMLESKDRNVSILDIGCGPGQFAQMLFDRGFKNYIGFDFSNQAISMAKERNQSMADRFFEANAFETELVKLDVDVYTCFEVLEHINDDLKLISRLSPGKELLASVPNYDSKGHVRHFAGIIEVYTRYSQVIDIQDIVTTNFDHGNKIFTFRGHIK
jgi:2-polyprenyl-3-methyl-5-hydroxy-6-metoxy-1,4-benzoquinol methylase